MAVSIRGLNFLELTHNSNNLKKLDLAPLFTETTAELAFFARIYLLKDFLSGIILNFKE